MNKTEEFLKFNEMFGFGLERKTKPGELLEACCWSYSDKRYKDLTAQCDDYGLLTISVCLL